MELLQLNRYQSNVKKTKEENKARVDSAQEIRNAQKGEKMLCKAVIGPSLGRLEGCICSIGYEKWQMRMDCMIVWNRR